MSFHETLKWLYGFQKYGIKLGLDRIRYLTKEQGNPQKKYKVIHIGGTNGKGSVCKFLERILSNSGYKVGLYTSPHLQHISERIIINNKKITEKELISQVNKIKPIVNKMLIKGDPPTFFEIITSIAFKYFNDKNLDFAIIEVGLGGRYDATNIVDPIITIITNVSLEHQNILGKKITDIALEKSGIIKKNVPLITAAKGDSLKIIKKISNQKNAPLYKINKEKWKRIYYNKYGQKFNIKGQLKNYLIRTQMLGEHQGENIALVINAIEIIQKNGIYIVENDIFHAIEKTLYPGRMEIISYSPVILLDGAHNKNGMISLRNSIKNDFKYNKLILILGILSDKNIPPILSTIIPISDIVIVTKSKNNRAIKPSDLKKMIINIDKNMNVIIKERIKDAVDYAKLISNKNDLICITGSLYTVGESRDYLI